MSFSLVQHASGSTGASAFPSEAVAFGSNNTAGNFLVCCARLPSGSGKTFTISDTQGNVWNQFPSFASNGTDFNTMWYAMNCKAGANTVTVAVSTGTNFFRMIVAEFSGVATYSAFLTSQSNFITAERWATPNFVTTQANELIIALGLTSGAGSTVDSPFNQRQTMTSAGTNYGAFGEQVVSAIGSYAGIGSGSTGPYMSIAASFKGNGSATPAYVQSRATTFSSTATLAFSSNNTAGNMLLVFVGNAAAGSTISDSQGNSYTQLFSNSSASYNSQRQVGWYALNCKVGANTVIIGTPGTNQSIIIAEYSGVATSSALDQNVLSVGATTHIFSGGIKPTNSSFLLLGFGSNVTSDNNSPTPDGTWTSVTSQDGNLFLAYQSGTAGPYGFGGTYSTEIQWYAAIAAFGPPVIGIPNSLMMAGSGT